MDIEIFSGQGNLEMELDAISQPALSNSPLWRDEEPLDHH